MSDTQENFDLIVSNLPYIESKDIELLDEELKHEPKTALDGGSDGITLIKELISQSKSLLLEGGMIALEIGDGQAETVSDVLLEEGYKKISLGNMILRTETAAVIGGFLLKNKGLSIKATKEILKKGINNLDDYHTSSIRADYIGNKIKQKSYSLLEKFKKLKTYGKKNTY